MTVFFDQQNVRPVARRSHRGDEAGRTASNNDDVIFST